MQVRTIIDEETRERSGPARRRRSRRSTTPSGAATSSSSASRRRTSSDRAQPTIDPRRVDAPRSPGVSTSAERHDGKARPSSARAGCRTRCWRRSSRSRSCSSSGLRARRCCSRCSCRTPSASTPSSSAWRIPPSCSPTRHYLDVVQDDGDLLACWWPAAASRSRCCSPCSPIALLRGAMVYKTLLIWPYAVAPAVAGVLWAVPVRARRRRRRATRCEQLGCDWNYLLDGDQAMVLIVMAAVWKQITYNFLFFLAGLQSIPKSLIEAAAIDGAGPWRRFWTIVFPLLSPTTFFLLVDQHRLRVLRHLRDRRRERPRAGRARTRRSSSTRSTTTASRRSTSAARRRSRSC